MKSKVPKSIKDKLFKYGVNLPTDRRTIAYENILNEKKLNQREYITYLKDIIAKQKKKEDAKIKQIIKQVKDAKIREEVRENAGEKPIRYIGTINIKYLVLDKYNKEVILTRTLYFDYTLKPSQLEKLKKELIFDDELYVLDISWVVKILKKNIKQTIKPVENTGRMENIRMRKAGAGLIDGYDKQDWDTNTGRCVFDYIISRYGNIKGFKNVCNYDDLNNIFDNSIWEEEKKDLFEIGVNTQEIQRFCEMYKIPMYAIDDNEKCFKQYTPQNRNKKAPAMIFRVSNEHFYPCPNKKVQSIIQTTSTINNIESVMTRNNFKVNDEEDKEYQNVNVEYVEDIMTKLVEVINNGGIPEKVNMLKKKLYGFKYGNITYVSNENIDLIKKLCSNMKIEYIGQSLGGIFKIILKDVIGNEALPKSTHNNYVFNILKDAKKNRARRGAIKDLDELENKENLKAFDLIKCYSSCMYNPTYDWIITDYNDTWEDYDDELKLGLYYVITEDTKLFKKSGYYSTCIIDKAIKENIEFKITKQLISKEKESKDLFKNIIDKILLYCDGDEKISKLVINLMSGMLGQSEKEGTKVKINSDIKQIFNFLDKYYQLEEGIMINQIENTDYFIYGFNKKITMNETNIPMYIQLLDESNIKLYDMIKNIGGELVAVKVDCAIIRNPINIPVGGTFTNPTEKWGTYIECEVPIITQNERCDHIEFIADNEWVDYDYNDSDNWEDIMEVLDKKGGLLLQASAGNGKTYVAKQIAKKLMEKGYGVKIIAPTNKAGLNIGGSTIHKFLKIDKEGNISSKLLKIVKEKYQYIIIDEISMIGKELWKRINLLKINSNIKFLLLGDEKQCPPVENEDIEDYFNHPAVKSICNYNRNILDVRKRYDEKLYNILEDVNNIKIDYIKEPLTERNICYFNKTRKRINKYWNDKKKKDGDLFILADEENDKTQDMYIYEGLPVIAMKTKHDGDNILFANSETFNVGNIDNEYISLCCERPDENGEKEIYIYDCPIEDFRDYFLINYCSTTHKSQGETITEEYTIYDWDGMTTKIKYTALSRAVKYENVYFGYGGRE
jgi:hypothetical protein